MNESAQTNMKLGVFDSGLGGVMIARAMRELIPDVDMVYLGDTLHLPYGNRSEDAIFTYTQNAVDYLFRELGCQLIIMACNTASASALRKIQQSYLPEHFPERRVLGVVVPTMEYALDQGYERLGLIGTNYTVRSNIYEEELQKINPDIRIFQVNTPLLVPLIEDDGMEWIDSVLDKYIQPLLKRDIQALILSCTHYSFLKDRIRDRYKIDVLSQDEIVPLKLHHYLERHPRISDRIGRHGRECFYVTDLTPNYSEKASAFFKKDIILQQTQVGMFKP